MSTKPLKRVPQLQSLSRDHHHGLLLSWKIRKGFSMNINPKRIKDYVDWFWISQLKDHFILEETYVFPLLGNNHPLIKKALSEHNKIQNLIEDSSDIITSLYALEEVLEAHIRFEERILFQEIQKTTTPEIYHESLLTHDQNLDCHIWPDEFWKS